MIFMKNSDIINDKMSKADKNTPAFSYELGKFTWISPDYPNHKGWALDEDLRAKVADGTISNIIIALDSATVKVDGGIGGVEIILNSHNNGFCIDQESYHWCWDEEAQSGGYISYEDLLECGYATLCSEIIYLRYDITEHPNYKGFKTEMSCAEWGEISIQYGLGMRIFPIVNAYLQSN
jgi:hypothetical protein